MELTDNRRQNAQRRSRERTNAYHIARHVVAPGQRLTRRVQCVEHFYRVSEKLLAYQSELRPQPPTFEQPRAGELLQLVQRF